MKLIFCFPGQAFSKNWMCAWNDTIRWLYRNNIEYITINAYSPVIYNCRNMLLGATGNPPRTFQPFNGVLDYDWIIWIDNDNIWTPEDLERLISVAEHKIVTGLYIQHDNKTYAQAVFHGDSRTNLLWLPKELVQVDGNRFQVAATGMGFMAVQQGVFESMECPFFRPVEYQINDDTTAFLSEDTGFCHRAIDAGYTVWADPCIQVQHEKAWLLSGDSTHGIKPENVMLNR
jgi:GT2 family glycosyltransferase